MTPDTPTPPRAPAWRRIVLHPLTWAAACAVAASPGALGASGPFFFVMGLIAGLLTGIWFVGVTFRLPRGRGTLLHVGVAVALVPIIVGGTELLPSLPLGTARSALAALMPALLPGAAWIWVGLWGRVISLVPRSAPRPAGEPLRWEQEGDAAIVRFRAIPVRMRTLALLIAATVLVAAAAVTVAVIALGDLAARLGPRLTIVAIGILFALPAFLALLGGLRVRTVDASVRSEGDRLRLRIGDETHDLRLRDIRVLRWRTDSDYARLELRTTRLDVSLLVGTARQNRGTASQLPPLSQRMLRIAQQEGLVVETSRRGVTTLRRMPEPAHPVPREV